MNTSYVRHWAKLFFPGHDVDRVLEVLAAFPATAGGHRPDFVYRAALRLAAGDLEALRDWLGRARADERGVLRASENAESWERVVDRFDRYARDADPIAPMARFVRRMAATPSRWRFRAGTSHGTLTISTELPISDEVTARLEDPVGRPGLLRVEYGDSRFGGPADPSILCPEADAPAVIVPLLEKLAGRGEAASPAPPVAGLPE